MNVERGVPLARMTTIGTGGPAKALARPRTIGELEEALRLAQGEGLDSVVVGLGSNVLAADDGVDALVVRLEGELAEIEALLHSPLTARRLHLRYCVRCGERVTNANVGGYDGRSALTGRLFCLACADALEDSQ